MSFLAEAPSVLWEALPRALVQALQLGVWAGLAWIPGRRILGSVRFTSRAEAVALPVATGLAWYGSVFFLLAAFGVYGPLGVGVTVVGTLLVAWFLPGDLRPRRADQAEEEPAPSGVEKILGGVLVGFALLPLVVLTLYPPTLNDATLYHLPFSQALWESGALGFLGDLRYPVFPLLQELSWGPLLAFHEDAGPAGLVLLETLLTALILYAWGRWRGSRRGGWVAAALWLGCPAVVLYGTAAFVDVGVALFVVASFYALDRFRATDHPRWLVVAGLLVGAAASSKYFGLFFLGALLGVVILRAAKHRRVSWVPLAGAAAVLIAAPTYLWIAGLTGNPVFPLFPEVFGFTEWSFYAPELAEVERIEGSPSPVERLQRLPRIPRRLARQAADSLGRGVSDLWNLPFELTVLPGARHGPPPFNAAFWLVLPCVLLPGVRRRLGGFGPSALVALAFVLFWFTTVRDARYLFPAVALLCAPLGVALGTALDRIEGSRELRRGLVTSSLALLLLPGIAYAMFRLTVLGPVPDDAGAREVFLSTTVRGYQSLMKLEDVRGSDYALYAVAPHLQYYARGRLFGDHFGPYRYDLLKPLWNDPVALHAQLRAWGADHLLVAGPLGRERRLDLLGRSEIFRLLERNSFGALFRLEAPPSPRTRSPVPTPKATLE